MNEQSSLKTLKDLFYGAESAGVCEIETLKQEAIKWVKFFEKAKKLKEGCGKVISIGACHFVNCGERDYNNIWFCDDCEKIQNLKEQTSRKTESSSVNVSSNIQRILTDTQGIAICNNCECVTKVLMDEDGNRFCGKCKTQNLQKQSRGSGNSHEGIRKAIRLTIKLYPHKHGEELASEIIKYLERLNVIEEENDKT